MSYQNYLPTFNLKWQMHLCGICQVLQATTDMLWKALKFIIIIQLQCNEMSLLVRIVHPQLLSNIFPLFFEQ